MGLGRLHQAFGFCLDCAQHQRCDSQSAPGQGGFDDSILLSTHLSPFVISDPTLQVDTATANLTVQEKESFPLDCSILSRSSPESHFAVTWYNLRAKEAGGHTEVDEEEEEEREAVLTVGPDAVFSPEASRWEGRLQFQRLSAVLFRLTVLQAGGADTGNYSCRVEEWLADPNGVWYRLAEEESGTVAVHVQDAGEKRQQPSWGHGPGIPCVFGSTKIKWPRSEWEEGLACTRANLWCRCFSSQPGGV